VNKENTLKLVRRFKVLYQDFYSDMRDSCMCWGFSHGDGWFDIIWQLSLAIEEELGYSWLQEQWYLFAKKYSRKWNKLIYKLSPVRQRKFHFEGSGKTGDPFHRVEDSYDPPPWDEKIAQFLFGKMTKVGKVEVERIALKKLRWDPQTGFAVVQVKEKFGGLRYYTNYGSDRINTFINLAERLADVTCEECGRVGKERPGSWIRTLCDTCAEPKENS
jgi:hypothetical protein